MNLKTIIFLIFTTFITVSVLAQDKRITYIGDIYYVSMKGRAEDNPEAIYKNEKGKHNLIVLNDKKAIFYKDSRTYLIFGKDSIAKSEYLYYDFKLFDKKKKASKTLKITYITETDSIKIDKNSDKKWEKITPDKMPKYDEKTIAWYAYLESQGINTDFVAPEIIFTNDTLQLKGYNCKKAYVTEGQRKYTVWFTEEIEYNWCFDDFRYLIPGTVILIEYEEKPYLEFVSIEELNYEKLSFDKKIIDVVLKNW